MEDVEMTKEARRALEEYDFKESCRREKEFNEDKAMRTVLSELATAVRGGSMTDEEAHAALEEKQNDSGQHKPLDYWFGELERYIRRQTTPHGAMAHVIQYAEKLLESFKGQKVCVPYWARTPVRQKMYVTMLILGAYGRTFMFAYNPVREALNISNHAITEFIDKAQDAKFLILTIRGAKHFCATRYCLCYGPPREAWKDLGKVLGSPNAEPTESYIRRKFSWMFVKGNYMNEPTYYNPEIFSRRKDEMVS